VVLAIIGLLGIGAAVVAVVFVGRAVDEAIDADGDDGLGLIPGLPGGDCVEFQFAYSTMTLGSFIGFGADPAQRDELEQALSEMRSTVPSEIEDDFEIVADAFTESMSIAFSGGGLVGGEPSQEQSAEAEAILESPEVTAAQDNINNGLTENCT
jgi:hypothetical protein